MQDRWPLIIDEDQVSRPTSSSRSSRSKEQILPAVQIRLALLATSLGLWVIILGVYRIIAG